MGIPWGGEGTSTCGKVSRSSSQLCAWLLTNPGCRENPSGKIPAGKSVVLRISHPSHPGDNRRDSSRLWEELPNPHQSVGMELEKRQDRDSPGVERPPGLGGDRDRDRERRLPQPGAAPGPVRGAGQPLPGCFMNLQLEQGRGEQPLLIARQIKLTQAAAAPGSGRGRDGWVDGSPVPAR